MVIDRALRARQSTAKYRLANKLKTFKYLRSAGHRFSAAKFKAKARGLSWVLDYDQYAGLLAKRCEYCRCRTNDTGVGLDRLDSAIGYELLNVVSCCWPCNMAKNAIFTPDEMRAEIGPAIRRVKLARGRGFRAQMIHGSARKDKRPV